MSDSRKTPLCAMTTAHENSAGAQAISFNAAGRPFFFITDHFEDAALSALLNFGAVPAPVSRCIGFSTEQNIIFMPGENDPASFPIPDTSDFIRTRYDNERSHTMLFDAERSRAVLPLPEDPSKRIRRVMFGMSAFVRLALRREGFFFLHASAVALRGRAAVFIGPNECGKSTLARFLSARGAHPLADDRLPALPSPPRAVKNREAFNTSGLSQIIIDALSHLGCYHSGHDSFFLPPDGALTAPIKSIFIPFWSGTESMSPCGEAERLISLYAANFTPLAGRDVLQYGLFADSLLQEASFYKIGIIRNTPPSEALIARVEEAVCAPAL